MNLPSADNLSNIDIVDYALYLLGGWRGVSTQDSTNEYMCWGRRPMKICQDYILWPTLRYIPPFWRALVSRYWKPSAVVVRS